VSFETHLGVFIKASGYVNLTRNNKGFDGISIEPGYEFSKGTWNGVFRSSRISSVTVATQLLLPSKLPLNFIWKMKTKSANRC